MQLTLPPSSQRLFSSVLWMVVLALLAYDAYWLMAGIGQPPLGTHDFRQTQTAISAYWIAKGGPLIAYETPILGAPWAIPFEFPLYQWFVALLSQTGLSIDVSGRLISFFFFIACLWPMRILCRQYRLPETTFLLAAALFLAAPIYTFWSRSVMIETTALFFGLAWLAFFARLQEKVTLVALVLAIAFGVGCALAKSTTFPAFIVVAFLIFFAALVSDLRRRAFLAAFQRCVVAGIVTLGPLAVGLAWVHFADVVKMQNAAGSRLTSSELTGWNYGNLGDRFSAKLWYDTIAKRVTRDIFGDWGVLAGLLLLLALTQRRYRVPALLCIVGFLTPFLIFTNLHTTHNYYQVANAVFAIAGVAIGIQALLDRVFAAGVAALVVLIAAQIAYFHRTRSEEISRDFTQDPLYQIAQLVREKTPEGSVVVVFGQDWSSVLPYEAQRRAVLVPPFFPASAYNDLLNRTDVFLGGLPLGGVVDCGLNSYGDKASLIAAYLAGRSELGSAGHCRLLSPSRS